MGKLRSNKLSAVVVGCARSCEPFLEDVLRNIENLTRLYCSIAFVFVENDSDDNTKTILRVWLEKHHDGRSRLISLEGLALREKRRTVRLAIARNAYMHHLNAAELSRFDHLIVVDFDNVNTCSISDNRFLEAIAFLEEREETAAVFANQSPYYDIWALRHEVWCPGDCWSEVANRPRYLPRHRAVERYVQKRQILIDVNTPPIRVQSAFGGLGIYKMHFARYARYVGSRHDQSEVCEHVSFNEDVARAGGLLYILPKLLNRAPAEHFSQPLAGLARYIADCDPRSYRDYASLMSRFRGQRELSRNKKEKVGGSKE